METRSWSQEKTVEAESERVMKPRHMKTEKKPTAIHGLWILCVSVLFCFILELSRLRVYVHSEAVDSAEDLGSVAFHSHSVEDTGTTK